MAIKFKSSANPVPKEAPATGFPDTVPAQLEPYVQGDALPVPDVIEKNSDSVWALWSDAAKPPPEKDEDNLPETQLMDFDDLPKDPDA